MPRLSRIVRGETGMHSAVLAGGTASRYGGQPKGLEKVGGERILDRIVQALEVATGRSPLLVANSPDARDWRPDLTLKSDVMPNCGSLGGILTALTAEEKAVLVVAWDMPFVTSELLEALAEGANEYDLFLPESEGPLGFEPLCGVYNFTCAEAILKQLKEEDFRVTGFHDEVKVGSLPIEEVRKHGNPEELFFNVNWPDDLKRAEELWRDQHATSK